MSNCSMKNGAEIKLYPPIKGRYIFEKSPVIGRHHYSVPVEIATMPGVTDKSYRLLSVLYAAFGYHGVIDFSIKGLAYRTQNSPIELCEELDRIEKDLNLIRVFYYTDYSIRQNQDKVCVQLIDYLNPSDRVPPPPVTLRGQYEKDLRDVRWTAKRERIKDRDGYACVRCEEIIGPFDVHHKEYISGRRPWEYPDELLETLCRECHHDATEESRKRGELW